MQTNDKVDRSRKGADATTYKSFFNPNANNFILELDDVNMTSISLDPNAVVFIPRKIYKITMSSNTEDIAEPPMLDCPCILPSFQDKGYEICALIVCIAALLIIPCFIIHELNPNGTKEQDLTPRTILKNIKSDNANKIIIGHLNINSIRNKFECLKYIIDKNVDILLISETKLDETFPEQQFHIEGFSPP